jgi:fructokinase
MHLGPEGVLILANDKEYSFGATDTIVKDKTGAGDFFAAGYLYGLQKKLSINESAEIANKSAAYVISEIGVRPKKPFN